MPNSEQTTLQLISVVGGGQTLRGVLCRVPGRLVPGVEAVVAKQDGPQRPQQVSEAREEGLGLDEAAELLIGRGPGQLLHQTDVAIDNLPRGVVSGRGEVHQQLVSRSLALAEDPVRVLSTK